MPFKRLFWSKTTSLHGIFSRSDNYERKALSKGRQRSQESQRDDPLVESLRPNKLDENSNTHDEKSVELQIGRSEQEKSLSDPIPGLSKNHENSQSFNKDSFNLTRATNYIAYRQDFHILMPPGPHSPEAILSRSPEDLPSTPMAGPSRHLYTLPEISTEILRRPKKPPSTVMSQRTARGPARCHIVRSDAKAMEMPADMPPDVQRYMKRMSRCINASECIFLFHPTPRVSYGEKRRYPPISVGDIGFFDGDGGFDPQFNVLDDAKNKDAGYETPGNFIDFVQFVKESGEYTGDYLVYKQNGIQPKAELNVGMKGPQSTEKMTRYEVLHSPSSCLYLPSGAELVTIRRNKFLLLFEDFMIRQGVLWTDFLKPRGIGKTKLDSIYVITKVYLTTSWAIASSETAEAGSTVTLIHSESDQEVLHWEDPPTDIKTYMSPPRESNPEGGTPARPTECIAVGGYKLDPPGQFIQSLTDIGQGVRNSIRGGHVTSMFERF